ncbi:cytochrome P450 [Xylaria bambusicola]|uniref:cytochrome P450 n=1 Tax=Xylaria bambusicola TaxID=326684 RepID=UPI0020072901|nr:cytochrome P450 [Xylaria bambusicola]KAI0528278.1 cytochrome P450 [Xylaria bambusicola]
MDSIILIAALAAGVISHLAFFRVGEHHLYGTRYILTALSAFAISTAVLSHLYELSLRAATDRSIAIAICYFGGLYSSLVIYRLAFHPLRRFPGPVGCKISSAWFATYLRRQDAFRQLAALHNKHGNFLRVGSNDLSIVHPKAVQIIYGQGTKCRKADWYDLTYPRVSLQSTRNDALHSRWRRVWSTAFGDRHLRDYEERMIQYRARLIKVLEESAGQSLDMTRWFANYSFDVMGELAFGRSFDMLETSVEHETIKLLTAGSAALGSKLPMWFFRIMIGIPGAASSWWSFLEYCIAQLDNRIQRKGEGDKKDILSSLLQPFNGNDPKGFDRGLLEGDTQLIIVAGSDTSSTTLATIFRYLAQYPHHIGLLRSELDPLHRNELGDYNFIELSNLKHLNGVINEALRLFPPVPTILPRLTPPEGLDIDGTFIPGNTTVFCPQFVISRGSESYVSPNDFIPERWYSQPELIRDSSGYAPFSTGNYGCVGRSLALLNIRLVVARIVADFDIRSTPAENYLAYDEKMREYFTLIPPPLNLGFIKRRVNEM